VLLLLSSGLVFIVADVFLFPIPVPELHLSQAAWFALRGLTAATLATLPIGLAYCFQGSSGFRVGRRPKPWRQEAGISRLGDAGDSWGQHGGAAGCGDAHGAALGRPDRVQAPRTSGPLPTDPARTRRRFHPREGHDSPTQDPEEPTKLN